MINKLFTLSIEVIIIEININKDVARNNNPMHDRYGVKNITILFTVSSESILSFILISLVSIKLNVKVNK